MVYGVLFGCLPSDRLELFPSITASRNNVKILLSCFSVDIYLISLGYALRNRCVGMVALSLIVRGNDRLLYKMAAPL